MNALATMVILHVAGGPTVAIARITAGMTRVPDSSGTRALAIRWAR